ncbi:MAG: hypothetical protein ACRCZM_04570 [Bacteroidales bacterium]
MDIGDYLYLIIFLGAALFSYVSKSMDTKKRADGSVPAEKHKNTPPQTVIIPQKGLSENETIKSEEVDNDDVHLKSKLRRINSSRVNNSNSRYNTEASLLVSNDSSIGNIDSEDLEKPFGFSDIEEVRRGIIYAEILNRKY